MQPAEKKPFKTSIERRGLFHTILETVKRKRETDPFFEEDSSPNEEEVGDENEEEKSQENGTKKLHIS